MSYKPYQRVTIRFITEGDSKITNPVDEPEVVAAKKGERKRKYCVCVLDTGGILASQYITMEARGSNLEGIAVLKLERDAVSDKSYKVTNDRNEEIYITIAYPTDIAKRVLKGDMIILTVIVSKDF